MINMEIRTDVLLIREGNPSVRKLLVNSLVLLCTVYSIHLKAVDSFITVRNITLAISLCILIFNMLILRKKCLNIGVYDKRFLFTTAFIFAYTILVYYLSFANKLPVESGVSSSFNFWVLVAFFPLIIEYRFSDEFEFCKSLAIANTFQSSIVILATFITSFRTYLERIQTFSTDRYTWRNIGLGIAGAGGSMYLCCGIIAIAYLIIFSKKPKLIYHILFVFNFFAVALVGRTGFYFACIIAVYTYVFASENVTRKFWRLVKVASVIFLCVMIVNYVVGSTQMDTNVLDYTIGRLDEIFTDTRTTDSLKEMTNRLPGISIDTLFGMGVTRGYTANGVLINHDAGWAKRYASIGLFMMIYSYLDYFFYQKNLLKGIDKHKAQFMWICIITLFVCEYKEAFIYMLALPFTIVMIIRLNKETALPQN